MPSITITAEQAQALADGRDITIEAPREPKRWIIEFENGNVFDVTTRLEVRTGNIHLQSVNGKLVAKGPHNKSVGHVQNSIGGLVRRCFEIDR